MTPETFLYLFAGLAVIVLVWGVFLYNRLVFLRQRCNNAFSQIDVQLKRRHDLVPNLVESVKAALAHERKTLENVTKARNQAMNVLQGLDNPADFRGLMALARGEEILTLCLGRLLARIEAYPRLRTSANVSQLMEELTSTENRIAFARQAFNDAAMAYNSTRESLPTMLFAGTMGFHELAYLKFKHKALEKPVAVTLAPSAT